MLVIGFLRKKLFVFNDDGEDDYGLGGMYFNFLMFFLYRLEKEVKVYILFIVCEIF